ncbi:PLP-dependent aminotransferase family protein [Streptomyces sp. CB01635]|uniref:aminotransferase-like domain-containing protein n=1 Tax=unclassified Streptomyces TaxID=2593676 RepID=UPI001F31C781|nr:PLP-dependent aminotransferase family protein [Streptomyces sp. CB01635]
MAAPRYKTLVDALASDIRTGRLAAGVRLPTHRGLAAREGIAVVTATRVYAELETMGLVSREQGRGTFVRDIAVPAGHGIDQQVVATDAVDLNFNYPSLPGQADLLRQALREVATSGDIDSLLHYQPHRGRPQDRASIARHLRRRGITTDADQVLIVNGAQHGLAITVMAALSAGDVVAVDALTYPGFKVLAHAFRLDLEPIPATADGPNLDALEKLCATRPVRAIYTMPTLHNPLGWVMPATQRTRLIEIARQHGSLIIEDASYAYLVEDPPPPLAATAPDITVYVSGLSKSVATGLRVGFVVAPPCGAVSRTRDSGDHLEHPGPHHRDRLPLARGRHGGPFGSAEARRRQGPPRTRETRAGRPTTHQPPLVLLHMAAAAGRRTRRSPDRHPRASAHLGIHG